jgi:hypothetical protein
MLDSILQDPSSDRLFSAEGLLDPEYTIQSIVQPVGQPHCPTGWAADCIVYTLHTIGCATRCPTDCKTGCIMYTQLYNDERNAAVLTM